MMTCTQYEYIDSKKTLRERIVAIDGLIDVMILRMGEVTEGLNPSVEEYQMDDGQMKIKTRYRTVSDVESGIKSLERMKQMYLNRLNGRTFYLRDVRSFR